MKILALVFTFLLMGSIAHADVMMPNTHFIPSCWRIANNYSDIVLFGEIIPIMGNMHNTTIVRINNGECIVADSYKFDSFRVYGVDRAYVDSVGGLDGLARGKVDYVGECPGGCYKNQINDSHAQMLSQELRPNSPYVVSDNDSTKKIYFNYVLEKTGDGYELKKDGEPVREYVFPNCADDVMTCKDGSTVMRNEGNDCEFDPCPVDMPPAPPGEPHTPTQPGALDAFWCWLVGLFGQRC